MTHFVPGRFDGKVALLTGAASGIGRSTVIQLVAEGARVLAVDVNEDGLKSLIDEVGSGEGGSGDGAARLIMRTGSITERAECVAAVEQCVAEFGRLDVLGNIAGISRAEHFGDLEEDHYRAMMAVNVDGPYFLSQAALPHLLEAEGNIVNIASNAGLMGTSYTVAYSMTKGAIVQLTRSMAMEFSKTKLRVNAIAPGFVTTGLTRNFHMPDNVDMDLLQPIMGYRGGADPSDIAGLFAFVASDDGRNMHGSIISSDLGLTAG